MSGVQSLITIIICAVGTMLTRFLPFIIFPENKETPVFLVYLGKVLPYAVIGLLAIYCLKDITLFPGGTSYALPQLIAVVFIVFLHVWKKNTLLSIGGGTVLYMVLLQYVFH